MRGRVIAAVLFLLSAAPVFPQCDYHLQYSGEFRASVFDIAIDGNDLWTASGYGVQLFNRSSEPPQLVATIGLPGVTRVIRASNGIAYAAGTNGINVVQRTGNSLALVRTIAIGNVTNLVLQPTALFAATPSGIIEFDLIDRTNPTRTNATFPTSSTAVSSITVIGSTLYAADGDSTIESFSIVVPSSPQKAGNVNSTLARPTLVEAIGTRLYASDGQRTEVFSPSGATLLSAGLLPFGATTIADLGSNVIAIAASDRQLRIIDATIPQTFVELFDDNTPPTSGNVNRIATLQVVNGELYVGGGDSGLSIYDVSHFAPPFPVRSYSGAATTSVVVLPNAMYFGKSGSGILEMTRSGSGGLTAGREWSSSAETVQDARDTFLVTSSGKTAKLWSLTSGTPSLVSSVTFAANVVTAALDGTTVIALLGDGTIWTADMSQLNPVAVRAPFAFGTVAQFAHSSAGVAATEISADGTTTLHFSPTVQGIITNTIIPGASTTLALGGDTAAVFTFRGITVVRGQAQELLTGSNSSVVIALQVANGKVIALTDTSMIRIWDVSSGRLEKEFFIPGTAVAINAQQDATVVGVATSSGVAVVNYGTSTTQPALLSRTPAGANTYYKKATATSTRLYLFDGRAIDMFDLGATGAPRWVGSIPAPGVVDIAASDSNVFTLTNSDIINEYSLAGVLLRSTPLNEGNDVTPLSIRVVAGAPWVSFSRGCTSATGCEKATDVFDPQSLVRTATLTGGIIDVTTNGSRAYAIFDLPSETRIYNVADPLHPSLVTTRATDVTASAIAYDNGTIYLLGTKAYAYSESSLTRTGEQLTSVTPTSSADLVIQNGCATIAGRSAAIENYSLPQWSSSAALGVPGTVRTLALSAGRVVILTDYSIEVWSRTTATTKSKRRAVAP